MIESCNHSSARICVSCIELNQREEELDDLYETVYRYEKLLFSMGAMDNPPCFKCGYNGPGYYNPKKHPCAYHHHKE